jgi:ubiquinone/menaquinone biosynthesis C-methylase UbiE
MQRGRSSSLTLTSGKLFFAPVGNNPQKVLDLGTGTGSWAIEGDSQRAL